MSAESLSDLTGPYEAWAYGAGAKYNTAAPTTMDQRYIAALGEFSTGFDPRLPANAGAKLGAGATGAAASYDATILTPTIWDPAVKGDGPMFWPLVLAVSPKPGADRTSLLSNTVLALRNTVFNTIMGGGTILSAPLDGVVTDAPPTPPAPAPQLKFGIRLNTSVPMETLDNAFDRNAIANRCKPGSNTRMLPPRAIVAIVDDGIPFAHRALRMAGNDAATRVSFCWLQSAEIHPDQDKRTVLFGRELLVGDINKLIGDSDGDEDALYRAAGATGAGKGPFPATSMDYASTHGSHVADLAAGFTPGQSWPPSAGAAGMDDVRIIAVQLPTPAMLDTTGFGKDAYVLSAFHYIFERASRLAAMHAPAGAPVVELPLIINFSYGFTGGPHNGGERLERAIAAMVQTRRETTAETHLVMPAGNDFLAALHGVITRDLATDGSFTIPWRIQPNDRTSNYLEIWLPPQADFTGVFMKVEPPAGVAEVIELSTLGAAQLFPANSVGNAIWQVSREHYDCGDGRFLWRIVIALAPTEPQLVPDNSGRLAPVIPSGLWNITLSGLSAALEKGDISCRIQRDNDPFGYSRGARQSYFDDRADERVTPTGRHPTDDNPPKAFVRRSGTVNGLATHDQATVVGGCYADSSDSGRSPRPADYTTASPPGLGPTYPGAVDVAASSEQSSVLRGIASAGSRSGSTLRMSGTSTAAPLVTRARALAYVAAAQADGSAAVAEAAGLLRAQADAIFAAQITPLDSGNFDGPDAPGKQPAKSSLTSRLGAGVLWARKS